MWDVKKLIVANSDLRLNNIILKILPNQYDEYSNNRNIKEKLLYLIQLLDYS